MTAKAALALALLEGRVLNVKNCFTEIGLSNIGREIPRLIEEPFGVEVSRTAMVGKNRYGSTTNYTNYRLNKTPFNAEGIEKMKTYCREQMGKHPAKTHKEEIIYRQTQLFLNQ